MWTNPIARYSLVWVALVHLLLSPYFSTRLPGQPESFPLRDHDSGHGRAIRRRPRQRSLHAANRRSLPLTAEAARPDGLRR